MRTFSVILLPALLFNASFDALDGVIQTLFFNPNKSVLVIMPEEPDLVVNLRTNFFESMKVFL